MSVGTIVWFRSGAAEQLWVEALGDLVDKPTLEGPQSVAAIMEARAAATLVGAPDVDLPDEDFRYSMLPIHDHYPYTSAAEFESRFPALNIVNKFTFYTDAPSDLDPRNPFSKFWIDNKKVQLAEEVAVAFRKLAAEARQGVDRQLIDIMLSIGRRPVDPFGGDFSDPTDEQHLQRLIGEAEAFADHCLWFTASRSAPVLVSIEVQS